MKLFFYRLCDFEKHICFCGWFCFAPFFEKQCRQMPVASNLLCQFLPGMLFKKRPKPVPKIRLSGRSWTADRYHEGIYFFQFCIGDREREKEEEGGRFNLV